MVYGEYAQEMPVELCKLLAKATPEPLEVTYLVNSGAEAIDGALKLAQKDTLDEKKSSLFIILITRQYPRSFVGFWERIS